MLSDGVPENYRGFLLNAQTLFSDNQYGLVVVQVTAVEGKWLRYIKVKPSARIVQSAFRFDTGPKMPR